MAYSKSINIFLPTGNAEGPIELEMLNWNGMVIKVPRKEVPTYADVELDKPGIYFLFCKEDSGEDAVYVGDATGSYFEDVSQLIVLGATANALPRTQGDVRPPCGQ